MDINQHKVIVYGVDTQIGLSLVRELGERGCFVVAIGKSVHSIGLTSRYVSCGYVLEGKTDAEKVLFLKKVNRETGAEHLLCVSEDDILFFNRVRDGIEPIRALVPEQEQIERVLSKEKTAEFAQKIGIDTPKSWSLECSEQVEEILPQLSFPLILKWSNPHAVMEKARETGRKIEKIIYCYSESELRHWVEYYAPLNAWPMIQEYCKGQGLGQFFFMYKGQPLLRFQHFRLHEWPPEGGFSTLCEGVSLSKHTELQDKSIALLNEIGWTGVAMVEYRYDPESDRAVLMEINGRFWGSLPLAYHSRIPFAWYTYQVLGCGIIPDEKQQTAPELLCRNTLVELKRLIRIVLQREKIKDKSLTFNSMSEILSFVFGFFNPRMRYYLFKVKDVKPFWQDVRNLFAKLFKVRS